MRFEAWLIVYTRGQRLAVSSATGDRTHATLPPQSQVGAAQSMLWVSMSDSYVLL